MNKWNYLIFLILITLITSNAIAQVYTQKGIVHKITRSSSDPIIPIEGVQVIISGEANVASDKNGRFTAKVKVDKERKFLFTDVRMPKGSAYFLALPGKGSRQEWNNSDFHVVLSYQDENNEFCKRQTLIQKRQLEKQFDAINKLRAEREEMLDNLNEKDVTYVKLKSECDSLRQLFTNFLTNKDKIDAEIKEIVDKLSLTDYQSLDTINRRIYELKCAGKWNEVNKLINSTCPNGFEEELKGLQRRNNDAKLKVEKAKNDLAEGLTKKGQAAKELRTFCEKIENKIEACMMLHQNDSVSYCYRLLIQADSTNWEYLNKAGLFENEYMADYNLSTKYHKAALSCTVNDTFKINSFNNIGLVYYNQGRYSDALDFFYKGIEFCLKLDTTDYQKGVIIICNIANVYIDKGEYSDAIDFFNKALEIEKKMRGDVNNEVAIILNSIGTVYLKQTIYQEALKYFKQALDIWGKIKEENNKNAAACYNNIGLVYNNQGNYSEALRYFNQALIMTKKFCGEVHPQIATILTNIGDYHFHKCEFNEAKSYYLQSLAIQKKIYDELHPDIARTFNNIGVVLNSQTNYSEALKYYNMALNIWKNYYGENHIDVASCLKNIGLAYNNQGNYSKSLQYFNQALIINKKMLGEMNSNVATCLNNIGLVYNKQMKYYDALKYFKQALNILKKIYGENHAYVVTALNKIGIINVRLGYYIEALKYYDKCIEIYNKVFGNNNNNTKAIMLEINTAKYYQALQKEDTAIQFMKTNTLIGSITENSPSSKRGMSGDYIILEYENWNIKNNTINVYNLNDSLRGKPKTLVFYKDGEIRQEHIDDKIGMILQIHSIEAKEKEKIINKYKVWFSTTKNTIK